ncbi:HAMP domain-containing sensor histidine kinase [Anaerocolumna sp. AGMB13025]|uniref:sensor histidine kinase n=1 Tax=Anaerocolumna sp. AGMB13025 TaxID=3039116 RepID=UPI00241C2826|nr:HAMP domain-containing sensor histidine kinase [Anaerocolumna sp. AGMB13025]WFR56981.1 HAMP domain-containing sensor histidine kinase [Anaerocolumna sp. AGMB13025]
MSRKKNFLIPCFTSLYILLFGIFLLIVLFLKDSFVKQVLLILSVLIILSVNVLFYSLLRRDICSFSDSLSSILEDLIDRKKDLKFDLVSETLLGKLELKLKRLYEILEHESEISNEEKAAVQSLVSDISHQVKTPISNIKMYLSILLERDVDIQKRREFLQAANLQVDKLDFLMQSLVKMSRLETGILEVCPKKADIVQTLAQTLGQIQLKAEQKQIEIQVDCPDKLLTCHDEKWTQEALFNLLDNAVKYTPFLGKITIAVIKQEFYTRIMIQDNGKGIPEKNQAAIFKRFYREPEVHDQEGVGIGLYLAREIISLELGYIEVRSEPGKGASFFVYLPNTQLSVK